MRRYIVSYFDNDGPNFRAFDAVDDVDATIVAGDIIEKYVGHCVADRVSVSRIIATAKQPKHPALVFMEVTP